MGDVIEFGKKPDRHWICACGSRHFILYEDGHVECSSCANLSMIGNWHDQVKPDPSIKPGTVHDIIDYPTVDFTKRALAKKIGEDTRLIVMCQSDGKVSAWFDQSGGYATTQERDWVLDRLRTAFNLIFGIPDETHKDDDECQLSMEL